VQSVRDPELQALLDGLSRNLYGSAPISIDLRSLADRLGKARRKYLGINKQSANSMLPQLNP